MASERERPVCSSCGGPRASLATMLRTSLERVDVIEQVVSAARRLRHERDQELVSRADAQAEEQLRSEMRAAVEMSADPRCALCIIANDPTVSWGHWAVTLGTCGIVDRREFEEVLRQRAPHCDGPLPNTLSHDVTIGGARYVVKYDVRSDASVFIFVLRHPRPDGAEEPRLIARGLIDNEHVTYNESGEKIWPASASVLQELEQVLRDRWLQMRDDLQRRGGGWRDAT